VKSFPEDDLKHKAMRDSFVTSSEHLAVLRDDLIKEEHEGLQKAKAPGEECPCSTCKAERFYEALMGLDRDQLLEIIASESGLTLDGTPCPKNTIEVVYEAQGGAGAGGNYGAGKLIKIHEETAAETFGNPK
jgi:hypothetical protein